MIKLIILGESPYNNLEQRGAIPFGYSREWILKNNLKLKIKDKKFPRDSLGNILRELSRTFPNQSFENFDLTLEELVSRNVIILNCYEDTQKKKEIVSSILKDYNKDIPILTLGVEASKFGKRFYFSKMIEGFHPSPRSRKSFVGSGCFFELENILNQNQTSLKSLFFGVNND